ncbi:hypothetical protein DZB87_26555 [Bacillus sp. ALD]|nr:hypothetical protein DZB87_26555 [Bacillus sp. ALD]
MIKDIAALVQICFYIVGATIAILTYRSAKRGLLNTVNTEYHKRVIDHLEKLSETLYSEFDPDSEVYFKRSFNLYEKLQKLLEEYNDEFKLHPSKDFLPVRYVERTNLEFRLWKLIKELKSSPFLPDHIVDYTVNYLTGRLDTITRVKDRSFEKIIQPELMKKEQINVSSKIGRSYVWEVKYNLKKTGCGEDEVELEVHKIRTMIKDYLKSFNPLP